MYEKVMNSPNKGAKLHYVFVKCLTISGFDERSCL